MKLDPGARERLSAVVLALLFAVHLLQCAGPLRLDLDAIAYLAVGASAADGNGFFLDGVPFSKPIGYPVLVASLDVAGLGKTWAFVLLNGVLLGLGLWSGRECLRRALGLDRAASTLICSLTLLSHLVVKFVPCPTNDVSFIGVSSLCLWALVVCEQRRDRRRWLYFAAALLLVVPAMMLRKVGCILIPAVLWVGLGGILARGRRVAWAVVPVFGLVGAAALVLLSRTDYFGGPLAKFEGRDLLPTLALVFESRVTELGSLAANVPESRIPGWAHGLLPVAGIAALAAVAVGLWSRRRQFGCTDVFVLSYLLLLFIWPYHYPRFWLPVLPFLLGYGALAVQSLGKGRVPVLRLYLVAYAAAGVAALAFSTVLTFCGPERFADLYGQGSMRSTYRAAFGLPGGHEADPRALEILRRYEPRAVFEDGSPSPGRPH